MAYDKNVLRLTLNLAVLFFFSQSMPGFQHNDLMWQSRNFFGVTRVYKQDDMHLHLLMNGTTLHGVQLLDKPMSFNRLNSYYYPVYGIAHLMEEENPALNIAVAGLGTGTLSCQFRSKDKLTFYEIDPAVISISQNTNLFSFLKSCPPQGGIIVGDARLKLAAAMPHRYNMIVVDVFTSDAIPIHLLTREALQLYLQKLTPDGIILVNISNCHVDLKPVLETLAGQFKLHALWYLSDKGDNPFQLASEWVALTSNIQLANEIQAQLKWKTLALNNQLLWTDDFSNILRVLK